MDKTWAPWQTWALVAVAAWGAGAFAFSHAMGPDWLGVYMMAPVWLPLLAVAVVSVLAWVAKKLNI